METCVGFPKCPELTFCVVRLMCTCFSSSGLPSMSQGLCVFSVPWACPLCCTVCVHCRSLWPSWLPGLLSALWGLHGLHRFVHWASLGTPGPPSVPWGLLWVSLSSLSLPSGQGYSLWAVYGLRSAAFCFLPLFSPSLCLAWERSFPWPYLWQSFPAHGTVLPLQTPSLSQDTSSCPEVFHVFLFYVSTLSYLISGSLDCLPWRPGFFFCLLEFAL